jgi:tetratricopeptide (TPR) repeat protein
VGVWWSRAHRWDFSLEVTRLVEQGDQLEWRGDTLHGLTNAEKVYRQALALAPDNPLIKAQLAALLARLNVQFPAPGRMQEIRSLTADAVERAPDHSMPWVARAKLLLLENKPQEAEQAALKAIDQDRDFDRGYTQLGEALIAEGHLEEGLKALRHAAGTRQGYVRARLILAAKLQDAVRYKEAAREFRNVLKYDPSHTTAKKNLGDIYLATDHSLEAIPLFQDVFEATHDFRSANSLGNAYYAQNRMTEAIATYKTAYELNPDPVVARNLGECYEKIGQKDDARRWYETAISSFDRIMSTGGGQRSELLYGRSYCAAQLGRYDEALGNLQEAISLNPNKTLFFFRGARISAMAGRREDVYSWTRRAINAGCTRDQFGKDQVFKDFQNDPKFQEILESNKH